jgi:type I restriction enzyme S subunit
MDKYNSYAEFKDSDIEWIGAVPNHWGVKPLFGVASTESLKNETGEKTNVLSLSYGNIIRRDVEKNFGLLPESFNTYQLVNSGDLILRLTDLQNDKRSLRVGHAKEEGIITSAYLKLTAKNSELNEYYFYRLLHSYDTTKVFYGMGGGLRQSMKFEEMRRLPMLVPPLSEQQKIANFLDHETVKIDTLIEKQQQLIKLLKEKRQAVISYAVTKGLNPNATMRDSGVEWLGEVPEHWEISKVKYLAELTPKKTEVETLKDRTCSFIPMEKLKKDLLILDETRQISQVFDGYTYFKDEDLLIAKVTPCFENKNMVVARGLHNGFGFGSSEIYVLRPNLESLNDFLYYRLQENVFMEMATAAMTGAGGLKRVPSDFLNNAQLALPPVKERLEIVGYIREYVSRFDNLMTNSECVIKLMQERRTALISAAVTGKIDVRNWVAPEPSSTNNKEDAT